MPIQRKRSILLDARAAVERLALPTSQQEEWVSRKRLSAQALLGLQTAALHEALADFSAEYSPVLRLRIEAVAHELDSISREREAMDGPAEAILRHSGWTVAHHLARGALRESGWPSL